MNHPPFYILRHGETAWNAQNRMQGKLNSPLTDKGKAQAMRQAEILADLDLVGFAAYCSPQGRAFETAGIAVARHIPMIRTDDRLCEIDVGEWQGKVRDGLWTGPLEETADGPIAMYEHAPGGEGFAVLEARCRAFLSDLSTPAVLITHGITSRMMRTVALGLDRSELGELPGGQGNVFYLENRMQKELK